MASTTQGRRLDVRLAAEHKELIERAATLLGQTLSAFTVSTLVREAEDVTQRFGTLQLTNRDRDAFLAALENPPRPNPKLRKAANRHTREVTS